MIKVPILAAFFHAAYRLTLLTVTIGLFPHT
ncbi:hypothetical protein Q667_18050 [Marinobacter sp. C1S70]|nr:hypothetical protein Q673_13220 [Marinobacter sp. EN3]ERS84752.1 hypothetical protein Q667_18050 [Marinobacter sp. C1S70]